MEYVLNDVAHFLSAFALMLILAYACGAYFHGRKSIYWGTVEVIAGVSALVGVILFFAQSQTRIVSVQQDIVKQDIANLKDLIDPPLGVDGRTTSVYVLNLNGYTNNYNRGYSVPPEFKQMLAVLKGISTSADLVKAVDNDSTGCRRAVQRQEQMRLQGNARSNLMVEVCSEISELYKVADRTVMRRGNEVYPVSSAELRKITDQIGIYWAYFLALALTLKLTKASSELHERFIERKERLKKLAAPTGSAPSGV